MIRVAILGATGSIGTSALSVAAAHPDRVRVVGLAAATSAEALAPAVQAHRPTAVSMATDEALAILSAAKIPGAPVLSPHQVLEDPHVRAGGYLQEVEYPGLPKPATLVTPGVELSATPATIRHRPPTIGEHSDEILGELGYAAGEIAALRARRVV